MGLKLPKASDLSKLQRQIIEQSKSKKITTVIGGPGTGKTVIAIQALNEFILNKLDNINANSSLNLDNLGLAIVVYSKTLRAYLTQNILNNERIKFDKDHIANTFHSWLFSFIKLNLADLKQAHLENLNIKDYIFKYYLKHSDKEFKPYDYQKIIYEIQKNKNFKKYEYFFIDEAQDLTDDEIKIIQLVSKNIFVTFDDVQKLGNDESDDSVENFKISSEILNILNCEENFYDLTDNFRNTYEIESLVRTIWQSSPSKNILKLPQISASRRGDKPTILEINSLEGLVNHLLIQKDRTPNDSIAIILPPFMPNLKYTFNQLKEKLNETLKKRNLSNLLFCKLGYSKDSVDEDSLKTNGIYLLSVKASKGLEFDQVYVIGTEAFKLDNVIHKNNLFVAMTRATKKLFLVSQVNQNQNEIINKIMKNPTLINKAVISDSNNSLSSGKKTLWFFIFIQMFLILKYT